MTQPQTLHLRETPVEPSRHEATRRTALAVILLLLLLTALIAGGLKILLPIGVEPITVDHRPGDLDDVTEATTHSLEQYWEDEFPAVYGEEFAPLKNGYQPKTADSPPWTCGGEKVTYQDLRGNAFYCGGPDDDYIAYDAELLFPRLNERFGSIAPTIVLAHEIGHAVQTRARVQAPSVVIELQADCLAGAWTRYAQASGSDPVNVGAGGLDSAVGAILALRDEPGTPATLPQAHGLGFDRVNAFQTGWKQGAARCANFPDGGVVTTELPFRTQDEALTGGNVPYALAVVLFNRSLDGFWAAEIPQLRPGLAYSPPQRSAVREPPLPHCRDRAGYEYHTIIDYCPEDSRIVWADGPLSRGHAVVGDLFTGTVLSHGVGRAVQSQAALPLVGRRAEMQRDCFTGAWVATFAGGNARSYVLSPGDVDEVLMTIMAGSGSTRPGDSEQAGAFARLDALREGLFRGVHACM